MSTTAPAVLRWSREIVAAATRHDLPPEIVAAMVHQESAGDPLAMRHEPAWRYWYLAHGSFQAPRGVSVPTERMQQATSWGLMQVMGAVARELDCAAPYLSALCDPALGLDLGCRYLARLVRRFGAIERAISAYNAGSPQAVGSDQWTRYVVPILARAPAYRVVLITGEP